MQMYLNDNDGVLPWYKCCAGHRHECEPEVICPKYIATRQVFQSPFDKRAASEAGDGTTALATASTQMSMRYRRNIADKISKPTTFIVFAPAQASTATVSFQAQEFRYRRHGLGCDEHSWRNGHRRNT